MRLEKNRKLKHSDHGVACGRKKPKKRKKVIIVLRTDVACGSCVRMLRADVECGSACEKILVSFVVNGSEIN